jgi:hypothetical protein
VARSDQQTHYRRPEVADRFICPLTDQVDYFLFARDPSRIDFKRWGHFLQADFGLGMIWEQRYVDVIPNKTVQQLGLIPELASLRESRRSEP